MDSDSDDELAEEEKQERKCRRKWRRNSGTLAEVMVLHGIAWSELDDLDLNLVKACSSKGAKRYEFLTAMLKPAKARYPMLTGAKIPLPPNFMDALCDGTLGSEDTDNVLSGFSPVLFHFPDNTAAADFEKLVKKLNRAQDDSGSGHSDRETLEADIENYHTALPSDMTVVLTTFARMAVTTEGALHSGLAHPIADQFRKLFLYAERKQLVLGARFKADSSLLGRVYRAVQQRCAAYVIGLHEGRSTQLDLPQVLSVIVDGLDHAHLPRILPDRLRALCLGDRRGRDQPGGASGGRAGGGGGQVGRPGGGANGRQGGGGTPGGAQGGAERVRDPSFAVVQAYIDLLANVQAPRSTTRRQAIREGGWVRVGGHPACLTWQTTGECMTNCACREDHGYVHSASDITAVCTFIESNTGDRALFRPSSN